MARRLWALLALALAVATVALAIAVAIARFPRGLTVLACFVIAVPLAWYGVRRRGALQIGALAVAAGLLAGAVALIIFEGKTGVDALVLVGCVATLAAARRAFTVHVRLPPAPVPQHPVLFYNPKSGDGKAAKFHVADEARKRGIEPVELKLGDDLRELVRAAVQNGADALAMAGGDGSQAIVADIASELGLPYACIPSGTRNHFALDLGVNRDDVVGALDAFTNGGERLVDLAEVNGQVFVNNVSLGLYAEAVQKEGYRNAKIRTILQTVPDSVGPEAVGPDGAGSDAAPIGVHWVSPDGTDSSGVAVLVSNNPYRLGKALSSGTRPRLDRGTLGIAVFGPLKAVGPQSARPPVGIRQWSDETFEVRSDGPIPAGVDGEAMVFDSPLRFRSRPQALRVRIAEAHPGASPSALQPNSLSATLGTLARFAFGRAEPDAEQTGSVQPA